MNAATVTTDDAKEVPAATHGRTYDVIAQTMERKSIMSMPRAWLF
jgi:hypothetical protein